MDYDLGAMKLLMLSVVQNAIRENDVDWLFRHGMYWLDVMGCDISERQMLGALAKSRCKNGR